MYKVGLVGSEGEVGVGEVEGVEGEGAGLTQGSESSEGVGIEAKLRQFSKSYHGPPPVSSQTKGKR